MVDPEKGCLVAEDEQIRVDNGSTSPSSSCTSVAGDCNKRCTHCNTTTTPLWRGGPAGPKTLCNACGIKHRKKRRAMEMDSSSNGATKPQKLKITHKKVAKKSGNNNGSGTVVNFVRSSTTEAATNNNNNSAMSSLPVKQFNRVLKKCRSHERKSKKYDGSGGGGGWFVSGLERKMGEEKRAALLLMALSCGSFSRFERKERKLLKELGVI